MPAAAAASASHLPPISVLFAAFLGYNPIQHLLGAHVLAGLHAHSQALLTGRGFFPQLISKPFHNGLDNAFVFSIVACLVAAAASWSRQAVRRLRELSQCRLRRCQSSPVIDSSDAA